MHVVLCNCAPNEARSIAKTVVEEGLAACVNVLPGVTSFYMWQGELEEENEHTLLIKVSDKQVERLHKRIADIHSYDTFEFVALPVEEERSDPAYVAWVKATD